HVLDAAVLVLEPYEHSGQLADVASDLLEKIARDLEVGSRRLDLSGGEPGVRDPRGGQLETAPDAPGHVAQDIVVVQAAASTASDGGRQPGVSAHKPQRTTQVSPRRSNAPRSPGVRSFAAAICAFTASS